MISTTFFLLIVIFNSFFRPSTNSAVLYIVLLPLSLLVLVLLNTIKIKCTQSCLLYVMESRHLIVGS